MGLNWATPLYLISLYGIVCYAVRRNPTKTGVNWSPLESVSVTLFIYFVSQLITGLFLYLVPMLFGLTEPRITQWLSKNTFGQFIAVVVMETISVALLLLFLRKRRATLATIGLKGRPAWRDAAYALAGFGAYIVIYTLVITITKKVIPEINLDQKQDIGFEHVSHLQIPLVFISLVVLPPIVEELVMRGFLYTGLKQELPKIAAMLITSILFALAHLQAGSSAPLLWVAGVDTFILSMVLLQLRDRTGKLWSPMMLHALKNLIAFLSLFIFHLA